MLKKGSINDFVFKQHCIPWKIKIMLNRLSNYRYLIFNINTKKYWDNVWSNEINNNSYKKRRLDNLYSQILALLPVNSKLLDVGCGIGVFLQRAKTEKKCSVFGIDISKRAIDFVKSKEIDGLAAKIPPIPLESNSFDVVVATELLEHVTNPLKTMRELFRVAEIGGLCFISVPDNCLLPYQEREHNHYFTEGRLKRVILNLNQNIKYNFFSVKEDNSNVKRLL